MHGGAVAAIVGVSILLAAQVARLTVADAVSETNPALAERLAPNLPAVLVSSAMAQVGQAAAQGQTPPPSTMEKLSELTRVAPLRAEPLLVRAAIAHKSGEADAAERMLRESLRRNPRSTAARYLLADLWLNQGRIAEGLTQMAILSRLLPGSIAQLAPALSEYAKTPGAGAELEVMLEANPQLKRPLLRVLAADPDNLSLILELDRAVSEPASSNPPPWQATVLDGLVARGDYEEAYALWRHLARFGGPRPLLFNGGFRRVAAPPVFNWTFNASRAGVAEPGDGRMRVLYYGREKAQLASQLLLLPAGDYRLSVGLSGSTSPGALAWTLYCLPGKRALARLELGNAGRSQLLFTVPTSGCDAQLIELTGFAQDMPKESDLLIGPLELRRAGW